MDLRNPPDRWGSISMLLHWTIVALIGWMAWRGLTMVDMPPTPAKINAYALHKSIGLTLLALMAVRLAWRLFAGTPKPVPGTPAWQERIASATHWAMYALLAAIPLSGWVFNSASGYPLQWFKLFNLPALAGRSEGLADTAIAVHEVGFWLLLVLVLVHAGAAFHHHLFRGDDTLRRMLPALRRAGAPRTPEH